MAARSHHRGRGPGWGRVTNAEEVQLLRQEISWKPLRKDIENLRVALNLLRSQADSGKGESRIAFLCSGLHLRRQECYTSSVACDFTASVSGVSSWRKPFWVFMSTCAPALDEYPHYLISLGLHSKAERCLVKLEFTIWVTVLGFAPALRSIRTIAADQCFHSQT